MSELKQKNQMLLDLRTKIKLGGGTEKCAKQHAMGKLTARERLEILFDPGTFFELNDSVESRISDFGMEQKRTPGDGAITGYGKINARLTFAASQDFTVIGGSLGEQQAAKICRVMDKALEMRVPFICINDSGGARIEEGMDGLSGYSSIFLRNTRASGIIPQIALMLGPCAGGACYSPAICDFIFMSEKAQMYITGPQVIKAVTGEEINAADLGGAEIHATRSGVAHFVYPSDQSCLEAVREFLHYLPQNNTEKPAFGKLCDVDRSTEIPQVVPDDLGLPYDVREVIERIADSGSFWEVQSDFAMNMVIGFSRFNGESVGIIANQPNHLAGAIDTDASDKAARFIRFCDCFNIPLLTLVDVPAFLPGSEQEYKGIIRHGAKILFAYAEASVPKITLIMRKAFGGAYLAMNSKNIGADLVYAWPIAQMAVMGAEGATNIIFRREIENATDPESKRAELIQTYSDKFLHPYTAAKHGYVDEVILMEETRSRILSALEMLRTKVSTPLPKKHGNIPL